jgi:hypothetical protein
MDDDAIAEPQPKVLKSIFPVLKPHVHDVPTGLAKPAKMGTIDRGCGVVQRGERK